MRTKEEMMEIILEAAKNDDRVAGVILSGSRSDQLGKIDLFSDFDIIYLVDDIDEILKEEDWFLKFGEVLISQDSNDQSENKPDLSQGFIKMMLFTDGNRIDLTLYNKSEVKNLLVDSSSKTLLDKDGFLKKVKMENQEAFLTKAPTKKEFEMVVNEFIWLTPYVAKGLWRRELPYAKNIYETPLRDSGETLLSWFAVVREKKDLPLGKYNKYLEKYLPNEIWIDYQKTYVGGAYTDVWEGLLAFFKLFDTVAKEVAEDCGFLYDKENSRKLYSYLERVRTLPKNAQSIWPD